VGRSSTHDSHVSHSSYTLSSIRRTSKAPLRLIKAWLQEGPPGPTLSYKRNAAAINCGTSFVPNGDSAAGGGKGPVSLPVESFYFSDLTSSVPFAGLQTATVRIALGDLLDSPTERVQTC